MRALALALPNNRQNIFSEYMKVPTWLLITAPFCLYFAVLALGSSRPLMFEARSERVDEATVRVRLHQGRTRVIVESLTVLVRFDTISEQKRDETKSTRPLTASAIELLVETVCDRHSPSGISFSMTLVWPRFTQSRRDAQLGRDVSQTCF